MARAPSADPAAIPFWRKLYHKTGSFRLAPRRAALRNGGGTVADGPSRLVISPGGVGTTFLMEHIARFCEINRPDDQDFLKHLPRLPERYLQERRVLFVSGDPLEILASLKRRGFLNQQSAKLGCVLCQYVRGRLRDRAFLRAVNDQIAFFSSAAAAGKPVLVVEYGDIWSRPKEIAAFFDIRDPRFIEDFPERKARKS